MMVVSIILLACSTTENEVPNHIEIDRVFLVHDEVHSPKLTNCSTEIVDFLRVDKNDCSFTLNGNEFDVEKKFEYNHKGECVVCWNYLSEGPVVYSKNDTAISKSDFDYFTSEYQHIKWNKKRKCVVINKSSMKVEAYLPDYHMLLLEQTPSQKNHGRKVLVQFK